MSKEQPKEKTAEEKIAEIKAEDLAKRAKGFNEKMIPLLKEFKLGLGAVAFLLPDGRIGAKPQLFDEEELKKQVGKQAPAKKPSEDDVVPQL